LIDVREELKDFVFTFQVIPQNFEVSIENTRPYVKTELNRQRIEGILSTADVADNLAVEVIMKADQEGKPLQVKWTHTADGKQHAFTVEEVIRKEAASKVKLNVNGASLGMSIAGFGSGNSALGDFVMGVKVDQRSDQHVVINSRIR
jgi:hypothetical protein